MRQNVDIEPHRPDRTTWSAPGQTAIGIVYNVVEYPCFPGISWAEVGTDNPIRHRRRDLQERTREQTSSMRAASPPCEEPPLRFIGTTPHPEGLPRSDGMAAALGLNDTPPTDFFRRPFSADPTRPTLPVTREEQLRIHVSAQSLQLPIAVLSERQEPSKRFR